MYVCVDLQVLAAEGLTAARDYVAAGQAYFISDDNPVSGRVLSLSLAVHCQIMERYDFVTQRLLTAAPVHLSAAMW